MPSKQRCCSEGAGGEVTAISVGGESAKEALKTALAMGCAQAILISDPALDGADSQAIAHVLAAAIRKDRRGGCRLSSAGRRSMATWASPRPKPRACWAGRCSAWSPA